MKTEGKHVHAILAIIFYTLLQTVIELLCLKERITKHLSICKLPLMMILSAANITSVSLKKFRMSLYAI